MYKNFNITESEKEQILNRLKENGYGQPINEQNAPNKKSVAPQTKQSGDTELKQKWETLKELTNNWVRNVPIYISKTLPKTIIITTDINKQRDNFLGYHQQSNGAWRQMKVSFIRFESNVKAVTGDLYYRIMDIGNYNGDQDSNQFAEEINQKIPNNIDMFTQLDYQGPIGEPFLYCFPENIDTTTKFNLFKQFDPNIGDQLLKDLKDEWYENGTWEERKAEILKTINEVLVLMGRQKPAAPIQGQPTAPTQTQKPLNEGQELLKDVFNNIIK